MQEWGALGSDVGSFPRFSVFFCGFWDKVLTNGSKCRNFVRFLGEYGLLPHDITRFTCFLCSDT